MADRVDIDFTYSLTDRVFRLSMGELADFSGAKQVSDLASAEGPRGEIVTWSGGPNSPFSALGPAPAIYAAVSEPTAVRLGPVQQVSPNEQAELAAPVYSPAGGRWIIAWRGHPQYQSPMSPGPTLVRVAFCPGACQ